MPLVPNGESFSAGATSGLMTSTLGLFRSTMDSLLIDGIDITLDLSPGEEDCIDPTCRFNPTYEQFVGSNGQLCRECLGKGHVYTQRQTIYKCNRRWTNELMDDAPDSPGGRIFGNFVRVKTHISSFTHIVDSISATVDGLKVYLVREPRKTSWNGSLLYVVSWWSRKNNKEG